MNLFKKNVNKNRRPAGGRRTTGARELPPAARFLLIWGGCFLGGFLLLCGSWVLFKNYYFKTRSLFVISDVHKDVTVSSGKMVKPDLILERFGLSNGVNQFSVDIDKQCEELIQTPNIRDVRIKRTLPDKLDVTIVEREPVAQISTGARGLVSDETGVLFMRYADTAMLPKIRVSDEFAQVKPGDQLSGMEMAAIETVLNAQRPDFPLHLYEVNARNEDYLLLTFSDYRKARFAWKGMNDPSVKREDSAIYLKEKLDNLAKAMGSAIGRGRQIWDATLDRIYAMPVVLE